MIRQSKVVRVEPLVRLATLTRDNELMDIGPKGCQMGNACPVNLPVAHALDHRVHHVADIDASLESPTQTLKVSSARGSLESVSHDRRAPTSTAWASWPCSKIPPSQTTPLVSSYKNNGDRPLTLLSLKSPLDSSIQMRPQRFAPCGS